MLIGREIIFIKNNIPSKAKAVGIDSTGGLVVALENGEATTLRSGEVSVVPQ